MDEAARRYIYVAGPYSAPTAEGRLQNVTRALDIGVALIDRGHWPFIPHLTHYLDAQAQRRGLPIPYEAWLAYDLHWLAWCNALYYLAPSPGADRERAWAEARHYPIYTTLADVPQVAMPFPPEDLR